jgi:hypothetical protein
MLLMVNTLSYMVTKTASDALQRFMETLAELLAIRQLES